MGRKELVITSRIGKVNIDLDKIIKFPRGLIGFERYQKFILLQIKENSPFWLLQSIDNSRLGLIVTDPFLFYPEYSFVLTSVEEKMLKIKGRGDIAVLVTVNIPPNLPEETTLNLSGPIVLNKNLRIGVQIAIIDNQIPTHLKLKEVNCRQQSSLAP